MSPRRSSLAVLALLLGAPVAGLLPAASAQAVVPRAAASAAPDAAHSDPDVVTRRLVRKVNQGRRVQARTWATRPVVRKLFGLRADGFRLAYPIDQCQYYGAADGYVCAVNLRQDGVLAGTAYVTVAGPEHDLLAKRVSVAIGE